MQVVRVLGKLEPGGAQLSLLRVSRELERRHGVRTTLVVGDASHDGLRLAQRYDVPTIAFRTGSAVHPRRNLQWEQSTRFAAWLTDKLGGADLVHAHMVGAWWAVAQVIDPVTPLIGTEHNEVNWTTRRIRSLQPAARRIDRFYAMGPAACQFAVNAGVRTEVIRPARSPVAGLSAAPRHGLRTPRLTFAGRFCQDKGPDVLVEAISLLDRTDVSAYLLGAGPLHASLAYRIHQLGLSARVFLPGWVDKPWTYIAGSAVHVVPSREEAWSQSAVLGLGLGVPVVGTHVDGLAHTLSHSRGVTVAPDDPLALSEAISGALTGRSPIDRAAGIRYARRFTTTRVAEFYLAEYQAMMTSRLALSRLRSKTPPEKTTRQPTRGSGRREDHSQVSQRPQPGHARPAPNAESAGASRGSHHRRRSTQP
jgi:glycosyltransferase involved in cell wall biosynthesis